MPMIVCPWCAERIDDLLENPFNYEDPFFSGFVREDGYLELRHFFIAYEIGMLKSYASEFMTRLCNLSDDPRFLTLATMIKP